MKAALFLLFLAVSPCPAGETDQSGKPFDFERLETRYTVLDFAASWCKPCWKALPHVAALADEFPQVQVLVICEDAKQVGRDELINKLGLTLPVIWDKDHRWADKFQPPGMPTTMILDEKGKILYHHVGFSQQSWQALRAELAKLITSP